MRTYYVIAFDESYKDKKKFTNRKEAMKFAKQISKERGCSVDIYIGIMNYLRFYWFNNKKETFQYSATGNWFLVNNRTLQPNY